MSRGQSRTSGRSSLITPLMYVWLAPKVAGGRSPAAFASAGCSATSIYGFVASLLFVKLLLLLVFDWFVIAMLCVLLFLFMAFLSYVVSYVCYSLRLLVGPRPARGRRGTPPAVPGPERWGAGDPRSPARGATWIIICTLNILKIT